MLLFFRMTLTFDEYLLYVNYESDYKSKVKTFDIAELAYNENTFVVLIDFINISACNSKSSSISATLCK